MPPTLLRRRMSRFSLTTVKFVISALASSSSSAWMFSNPTSNAPILPVTRPPPTIGTTVRFCSPICRL